MNKKFLVGLFIFYILIAFSPNKIIYFSAYFISALFFYVSTRNIRISLFYTLILSVFSEIGLAGSWFLMDPKELNLGSGYWISPLTVIMAALIPLTFGHFKIRYRKADLIILLFFIWNTVNFILFPYTNALYGLINLGEMVLFYFLSRVYLSKENLSDVAILLMSMLVFQTGIGLLQWLFQRPLGLVAESVLVSNQFGITASEDTSLFRITGTLGHPNLLASFFLSFIPFQIFSGKKRKFKYLTLFLSFIALFFTYSRAAWLVGFLYLSILFKNELWNISRSFKLRYFLLLLIFIPFFIFFMPNLTARLDTFSQAMEEFGSVEVRLKLLSEASSIIIQFPFTGVGLNRSLEVFSENPVTNIFEKIVPSGFYRIHNTPLEMASEIGIPGLLLFLLFLFFVFKSFFSGKKNYLKNAAALGLSGLLFISLFNPFFHSSQFRLFFLLSAIIML